MCASPIATPVLSSCRETYGPRQLLMCDAFRAFPHASVAPDAGAVVSSVSWEGYRVTAFRYSAIPWLRPKKVWDSADCFDSLIRPTICGNTTAPIIATIASATRISTVEKPGRRLERENVSNWR